MEAWTVPSGKWRASARAGPWTLAQTAAGVRRPGRIPANAADTLTSGVQRVLWGMVGGLFVGAFTMAFTQDAAAVLGGAGTGSALGIIIVTSGREGGRPRRT